MKRKSLLKLVSAICLAALIAIPFAAGCAAPAPAPAPEEAWQWPKAIKMQTLGVGGALQMSMASWAPLLEKDTGMKVRLIPEYSYPTMPKWRRQGVVDFGVAWCPDWGYALTPSLNGYADRDGGPLQDRILWIGQVAPNPPIVKGDSGIHTQTDLKGKRLAYCPALPSIDPFIDAQLGFGGLTRDDVTIVPFGDYRGMINSLKEGTADMCMAVPSAPFVQELASMPCGVGFLENNPSADPEATTRYFATYPYAAWLVNKDIGVKEAHGLWLSHEFYFIVCTEDTDPELTYHIVKWLDENYDKYKDLTTINKTLGIDWMKAWLGMSLIPLHEGTIKYLKEVGVWEKEYDAIQEENIRILTAYCDAYKEAIDLADAKGMRVDATNEEWITLWEDYKKELNLPAPGAFLYKK